MAAIGTGWADGAFIEASFITAGNGAWSQVANDPPEPTTWFDDQQSQALGTRSIVHPGYHKNGRNY